MIVVLLLLQTGLSLLYPRTELLLTKWQAQFEHNATQKAAHLTLSLKDYRQDICGTNEISVRGRLYNVALVVVCGESVDLLVLNEICDEDIVDEIARTLKRTAPQDHHESMQEFLTFDCILPEAFSGMSGIMPGSLAFSNQLFFLVGESPDIPSPPPQLV